MIKNETVLEHVNKTYTVYAYFTKPTSTFICCPKLNFFLNNFNDVAFLIVLGTNSQIFRARKDMVSVPKYTERMYVLFKVELFLSV